MIMPMILVRLDPIRSIALPDLIERAWRMRASKTLLAQFASTALRRTARATAR